MIDPAPPAEPSCSARENEPPPAVLGCVVAARRCQHVARMLTPEQFGLEQNGYHSIGAHLRHCFDHQAALVRGLAAGLIDYDARDRDPELERCPEKFIAAMEATLGTLATLPAKSMELPLAIRTTAAEGEPPVEIRTTLGRELSFLSSHNIHHLAIVRMLAGTMGLEIPKDFGVAYSTQAYWSRQSARA